MSNAKDNIRKLTEAGGPDDPPENPLGGPAPTRPPMKLSGKMRRIPLHQPGSEFGDEGAEGGGPSPDVERVMGGAPGPKSQFNPKETSQLKDVVILMLATMANSDMDKQIAQAFMTGQPLEPGLLQHILDEARNLALPEAYGQLMQKIFQKIGH